jgi:hypothetical protein
LLPSVWVLTQAPLQTIWPPGQAQPPFTQLAPVGHVFPHAPQLRGSLVRFTQLLLQLV